MLSSLTGVSVRRVKMPIGLIAGPRKFRTVLVRDQTWLLIFLIAAALHICLLWLWRETGVIKETQCWTFCLAHCNCVMSNIHSRWQVDETFCAMTKGTYDQPNSFGDAKHYAQR